MERANLVVNIRNVLIVIYIQTHPYIYDQRGSIFPYYIPEGYCFVSEITTLRVQPYRTAAVVGYIMYMRVASPCYAEANCFRLHEGTILNRTTIKTIQRNFS